MVKHSLYDEPSQLCRHFRFLISESNDVAMELKTMGINNILFAEKQCELLFRQLLSGMALF